jgi:hypothetical protein
VRRPRLTLETFVRKRRLRFSVTVSDLTRRDQDLRMMQGDDTKRSVDDGEDKFVIPNKQALQLRTARTSFI